MKYTSAKKRLSLALAALMLAAAVSTTACGSADAESADTTAAPSAADTTAAPTETTDSKYDANGYLKDDLPEDLDYGKDQFNILAWKQSVTEYYVEEQTGDVIDNALYNRNMAVEERLGVELVFNEIPGNSGAFREYCQTVMNSVNANAQAYDAIACYLRSAGVLTLNHMLIDLLEVEHINFEQPWWSDSLVELNTINDKLYFMSGDIATSLLYQMMFMIYNNDLGTDLGLENPQKLAIEGKWTQDKMFELATGVYADLDGNGIKTEEDRFGLFSYTHPNLDIFYMGADLHYIEPNEEGTLVLSDDVLSEKSLGILDKLITLYYTSNDGYFTKSISSNAVMSAGHSLMYNITGQFLQQIFRNGDMEYSILPAPKYDEKQENYLTTMAFTHSMYCIPLDARDTAMSGAVLECMASEGYRKVTPALFETAFKYQYSNSQYDADIFELIRSGVVFDIGRPFFDELGGDSSSPVRIWRTQVEVGTNQLPIISKMYEKMWTNTLTKMSGKLKVD